MDDWRLLEQYRRERSNAAFARLVERHVGLVYHACRRRLGDAHLAEDATQAVFVLLARRGPRAPAPGTTLAGWLYRTALHACANVHRARVRRQHHERIAAQLRQESTHLNDRVTPSELAIEQALGRLSGADRDLVLMRFYEDRDLEQIGATLGISSNTAAKRLSRAIARMRRYFPGSMCLSAPAIEALLVEQLHLPAPPGLGQQVVHAAADGVVSSAVESITKGVIQAMLQIKAKLVAATVGMVVLGVGGGLLSVSLLRAQSSGSGASEPAAAKAPATNPAASSPKQTFRDFAAAIRKGDPAAMKALVQASDADNQRLLQIACDYVQSGAEFKKAVADKFGPDASRQLAALQTLTPIDYLGSVIDSVVDQLEEAIDGDEAELRSPDGSFDTFYFVKDGGQWKISADRMTETWSPQDWESRAGLMQQMTESMKMLTQNVQDERYANVDELRQEIEAARGR